MKSMTDMMPIIRYKEFSEPWVRCKLNELLIVVTDKNHGNYTKKDVLSVSDEFGCINQIRFQGRSFASEDISNYKIARKGDIIYTRSPLKSKPYGIIKIVDQEEGIVSPLYIVNKAKHGYDSQFIYRVFDSPLKTNKYLSPLVRKGAKNTMNISNDEWLSGEINIAPSIKEQREIGEYFYKLDYIISLYQCKLEQQKKLKKYFLQNMFPAKGEKVPKIRLKGFTGDWKIFKIGNITNVLSASRVHKEEWVSDGVPFFRSSDIVAAFKGIKNDKTYISFDLYNKLIKVSGKLERDDILITGGGSIGTPYIVPSNKPLYSKDADLIWIKHSSNFDSRYLYTYFTTDIFKGYLHSISHTGTIAHYTIEQVKDTPLALPTTDEQRKIGNYIGHINNDITFYQRKIEVFQNLKKYMLQNMFI